MKEPVVRKESINKVKRSKTDNAGESSWLPFIEDAYYTNERFRKFVLRIRDCVKEQRKAKGINV